MTTQTYQQASQRFLAQAKQELADGDLPQASEKGWALGYRPNTQGHRRTARLGTQPTPALPQNDVSRLRSETGDGDIAHLFAAWPACSTRTSTKTRWKPMT